MFADPQSVTIASIGATDLPLTSRNGTTSIYEDRSEGLTLTVSHRKQKGNVTSSLVKLDSKKVAPSPYNADQSNVVTASVHCVVTYPETGFSEADLLELMIGFDQYMDTPGNRLKLLNGES